MDYASGQSYTILISRKDMYQDTYLGKEEFSALA
jgi:hypothetical protein